jgi:hypothetical protein
MGGHHLGRVYGEPAEAASGEDGQPAWFRWRGRHYTVGSVIGHWVVNREWWKDPGTEPDQPELEFWRVEASSGRSGPAGTYELCRDVAAATWTLRGVAD